MRVGGRGVAVAIGVVRRRGRRLARDGGPPGPLPLLHAGLEPGAADREDEDARAEDGTFSVTYADNGLAAAANALSGALLPYGIKSLLLVDGKAVSLEDALKMAKSGGKIEIVEEPASEPQAASAAADNAAPAPE